MAKQTATEKKAAKARGGWEYRVHKPLERSGLGDEEWGTQYADELTKLGAEGWEVCGQAGSAHLLLKRQK